MKNRQTDKQYRFLINFLINLLRYGHHEVVSSLLEKGADPNLTNKFGMTALHHAAVNGDPLVIQALIKGKNKTWSKGERGGSKSKCFEICKTSQKFVGSLKVQQLKVQQFKKVLKYE